MSAAPPLPKGRRRTATTGRTATWWEERRTRREQLALLRALRPCPDLSSGGRTFRPLPNNNCVARKATGRTQR